MSTKKGRRFPPWYQATLCARGRRFYRAAGTELLRPAPGTLILEGDAESGVGARVTGPVSQNTAVKSFRLRQPPGLIVEHQRSFELSGFRRNCTHASGTPRRNSGSRV